jgi:uncharacterized protein
MESRCPICKSAVREGRPQNPSAPFCSARCRTIDLGRWLDGAYRIPVRDELPTEEELALASVRDLDPRRVS